MLFADFETQARYDRCIANGCTPALAEMLALKKFPGVRTGGALMRGVATDDGLGEGMVADRLRAEADRRGVSRAGKRWVGGLAAYPGDPRAWVGDEHDVRALARERNYAVSGAVNVEGRDSGPPPPPVRVAPDIVAEEIRQRTAMDPALAHRDQRELAEQITDEMALPMADPHPVIPDVARPMVEALARRE